MIQAGTVISLCEKVRASLSDVFTDTQWILVNVHLTLLNAANFSYML